MILDDVNIGLKGTFWWEWNPKVFWVKSRFNEAFPGGPVVKNPSCKTRDTVRPLVGEVPTGPGATEPVQHNYWACAPEATRCSCWSPGPRACAPQEKPPQWEAIGPWWGTALARCSGRKSTCKDLPQPNSKSILKKKSWLYGLRAMFVSLGDGFFI